MNINGHKPHMQPEIINFPAVFVVNVALLVVMCFARWVC